MLRRKFRQPATSNEAIDPSTMLMLFSVDARHHGLGPVKYAWDPHGKYVASTGSSRVAHIFGRRGKLVDQVVPPSPR